MSFLLQDKNFLNRVLKLTNAQSSATGAAAAPVAPPTLTPSQQTGIRDMVEQVLSGILSASGADNLNFGSNGAQFNTFLQGLSINNLSNINSFIDYLKNNQIKYKNIPIVIDGTTTAQGYVKLNNSNVNVQGLKGIIQYLKGSDAFKSDKFFKTLVDSLSAKAESIEGFKDAGEQDVEQNKFIGAFSRTIDINVPYRRGNEVQLFSKDIKDFRLLSRWVGVNGIIIKAGNQAIEDNEKVFAFIKYLCEKVSEPSTFTPADKAKLVQISTSAGCPQQWIPQISGAAAQANPADVARLKEEFNRFIQSPNLFVNGSINLDTLIEFFTKYVPLAGNYASAIQSRISSLGAIKNGLSLPSGVLQLETVATLIPVGADRKSYGTRVKNILSELRIIFNDAYTVYNSYCTSTNLADKFSSIFRSNSAQLNNLIIAAENVEKNG